MPAGAGLKLIASTRIQKVMRTLLDVRQIPQQLKWLNRMPLVDAVDQEITMRFTNRVIAADILPANAKAVVGQYNEATLEAVKIPNIKRGVNFPQHYLDILDRLERSGAGLPEDEGFLTNHIMFTLDSIIVGVRQRMEHLATAMTVNALTYNRLGVVMSVTFGMPSDLQVTPSVPWSTAASATPITDMQALKLTALTTYGKEYNRVTMSTAAFNYMIATTEFKNQAALYFVGLGNFATGGGFTGNSYPTNNQALLRSMAARILDMELELYDAQYFQQDAGGAVAASRYLPANKVVMSNSNDDNSGAFDMANAVVTESIAASLSDTPNKAFSGPTRGPTAYKTNQSELNPPDLTIWGVARCFPRLHQQTAFAVLTVYTL